MASPIEGVILDVIAPGDYIKFRSFEPPSYRRNVVYDDAHVRGRSEPHVFYGNTDARVWTFIIHFYASIDEKDEGSPKSVKYKTRFLESLEMPDYGDIPGQRSAVVYPPHAARITILDIIDAEGSIRDLSITHKPPYDLTTGFTQLVEAQFSFHEHREYGKYTPLGYADIRSIYKRGNTV